MNDDMEVVLGNKVTVKTRKGDVVIRELQFEDVSFLVQSFIVLFKDIPKEAFEKMGDEDKLGIVLRLFNDESLSKTLKDIFCRVSDQNAGYFDHMPLVDMIKVIKAFIEVNPLEELRDLFFVIKGHLIAKGKQK